MDNRRQILRLLALENSPNDVERWIKLFRNAGLPSRVQYVSSIETLEAALQESEWDAALSIEEASSLNAQQLISTVKKHNKDIPVLITMPEYNPQQSATWLSSGARDAIPDTDEEHILQAIIREQASLSDRRKLKHTLQELEAANQRCELLLANASEAIAYIHFGMHVDANAAYLQLTGYDSVDDLAGISLIDMFAEPHKTEIKNLLKTFDANQYAAPVTSELVQADGSKTPVSLTLSGAQYDDEPCIQLTLTPLSVPILNQPVTQKTNIDDKQQFLAKAENTIQSTGEVSLAWIQLDDFESIRHDASIEGIKSIQTTIGELLLKEFPMANCCQYTEDTFVVLEADSPAKHMSKHLETLQSNIDEHLFGSTEETLTATVTIGFVVQEKDDKNENQSLEVLLKNAESACQLAMKKGGTRLLQYSKTEELKNQANEGNIKAMIRQALTHDSFHLLFQPIVNITGSEEQHYEVFLRLVSPQGEVVEASSFIETAESSGLMPHIDRWVLRQSVRQLSQVRKHGENIALLIHVNPQSVQGTELVKYLSGLLKATDLPPQSIILQMPESIVLQQLKKIVTFSKAIHSIGCQLAITSFQGDSRSMKVLQHLDVNFVRLDASLTDKLGEQADKKRDEKMIELLNTLRERKTRSIATKVESSQTLAHLWHLGADFAQGYYIQEPSEMMNFEFE